MEIRNANSTLQSNVVKPSFQANMSLSGGLEGNREVKELVDYLAKNTDNAKYRDIDADIMEISDGKYEMSVSVPQKNDTYELVATFGADVGNEILDMQKETVLGKLKNIFNVAKHNAEITEKATNLMLELATPDEIKYGDWDDLTDKIYGTILSKVDQITHETLAQDEVLSKIEYLA